MSEIQRVDTVQAAIEEERWAANRGAKRRLVALGVGLTLLASCHVPVEDAGSAPGSVSADTSFEDCTPPDSPRLLDDGPLTGDPTTI